MNRYCIFLMALSVFALAGCTSGGSASIEPAQVVVYDGDRGCEVDRPGASGIFPGNGARPGSIDLECFSFPDQLGVGEAYKLAKNDKNARDRLANILILQSDSVCTIEKAVMLERQAEVNGWLSIAATGLSISSGIVSGELASDILAGGSGLANASRDHVNTHVYRNQIIQSITSAIDGKRDESRAKIERSFGKEIHEYSVDQSIREVNDYHKLCSFGVGLKVLMEAVENQKEYKESLRILALESEIDRLEGSVGNEDKIDQLNSDLIEARTGIRVGN